MCVCVFVCVCVCVHMLCISNTFNCAKLTVLAVNTGSVGCHETSRIQSWYTSVKDRTTKYRGGREGEWSEEV